MSAVLPALLLGLGLAIVVARRRSAAVALLAVQSLLLGAVALHDAAGGAGALAAPAVVLLLRGVVVPLALARIVHATREPRRVAAEPFALGRLVTAVALVVATAALVPALAVEDAATWRAAAALVVLGIAIAALRRPIVLQAIGVLVAENGVYLATLAVAGGVPAAIELGVVCDLVVVVAVVAAFGVAIHARLGSGDTTLLETLRD